MLIGIDGNEANVDKRVGSGQYAFELLKHLSRIAEKEKKHQFTVYLKDRPLSDFPPSSKNWHYRVFGPKKLWTQIALPLNLYFGKNRPDVFLSLTHYGPRFCPVPLVIVVFDLGYVFFPEYFKKSDLMQLKSWTAYSVKKAKTIITISQSTKNDIVKYYQKNPQDIVIAYPGYNQLEFKPLKDASKIKAVCQKYHLQNPFILYLGTLQPRKNLIRLIQSFALLIKDHPQLDLVIAGKKGWLYDEIFLQVQKLRLEDKIIFTDFIPSEDLPFLMNAARVYALPSLYEGFGIPVLEAMACGTPVVCSNVSSLPEVGGDAVIYVDPKDLKSIAGGISESLKPETAKELSVKGLEQAKKFSWQTCAKITLEVLTNLK